MLTCKNIERCQCCGTGQRIAPKSAAMHTFGYASAFDNTLPQPHSSHWDTTRQRFSKTKDIRLDAVLFTREKRTSAPKPRLNLVNNQQCTAFPTQTRHTLNILITSDMYATLTLHQFENDSSRILINRIFSGSQIVIAYMPDIGNQRCERFAVVRLPRSRERPHATTMKAAQCGNNPGTARHQTSKFERTFNGFSPTVTQKKVRDALRRNLCQTLKQICTHIIIDNLRTRNNALSLGSQGSRNLCTAMTNISDTMTC